VDNLPPIELYRKYLVEDPPRKLSMRVVMVGDTKRFLLTLYRLRIEGRGPYHLEKKIERYLEDQPFP
jgi:hypothetical protein